MAGCVFCEIVTASRSAHVVLDTEGVLGFLDARPLFPGHVLVVPKAHHQTIADLPTELVGPLFTQVQRVAAAVQVAVGSQGTFVAMNNVVSQSVPHLHVHVVPRTKGDGLKGFFWPRTGYDDDGHAERVAVAIAAELGSG